MSENMKIYEAVRNVPDEAKKEIRAGRLKGMTDINPMWRIKVLTEQFGPCGTGWYYEIADKCLYSLPTYENPTEVVASVVINLYVKIDDEWSNPIVGIGGSKILSQESRGAYVNDEAFKMALTDAISVACKALGMGADVYWGADNTKYNDNKKEQFDGMDEQISATEVKSLKEYIKTKGADAEAIKEHYKVADLSALSKAQYGQIVRHLMSK